MALAYFVNEYWDMNRSFIGLEKCYIRHVIRHERGIKIPAKVERKVMKHGSSGVVAIPMSYRKYHGINHGDEMIVLYDSLLLMYPTSMAHIVEERKDLIDELLGMPKKPTENEEKIIAVPKEMEIPVAGDVAFHSHPDSVTTNLKMNAQNKEKDEGT